MMRTAICLAAALLVAALVTPARALELRHAEAVHGQHIKAKYLQQFQDLVKQKTGGAIEIKTYYSDTLYSIDAGLKALSTGELDLMSPPFARLSNLAPESVALEVPFLFRDAQHLTRLMESPALTQLLSRLDRFGIVAMSGWPEGTYVVIGRSGFIATPETFKGKRIRNSGHKPSEELFRMLGATPVRVPISETYSALDQGLAGGALTNIASYRAQNLFEIARHAVYWPIVGNYVLLGSRERLSKLPEAQREAIRTAWAEVGAVMRRDMDADEAEKIREMEAKGAKIRPLSDGEIAALKKAGGGEILERYRKEIPEVFTLVEELR